MVVAATRLRSATCPSPSAVITRWPRDCPLVALVSWGDADGDAAAGWSLLATPAAWRTAAANALRTGPAAVDGVRRMLRPPSPPSPPSPTTTRDHDRTLGEQCPFGPGWIASLAYELGRRFEPAMGRPAGPLDGGPGAAAPAEARDDRQWPDVLLARVDGGLALEHATNTWWWFGDAPADIRRRLLAAWTTAATDGPAEHDLPPATVAGGERRSLDDAGHEAAVARARAAIASGEIFQANITRRRTVRFDGSLRRLALTAFDVARPRHGAIIEAPGGRGLVSLSPELFLAAGPAHAPDRIVRTRPIKGTAPAPAGAEPDPRGAAGLLASEKDAAELTMIVDLMRNDLGRVAAPGGVSVSRERHVETHATVHHAVAEVRARLREDVDVASLLAATFPPGSITGAPKIRAMQVIDRLEPVCRGPYCGSIGWIGDDGSVRLNVAIRTLAVSPDGATSHSPALGAPVDAADHRSGWLDYASGGGIVADSDPVAERIEADVKAEVFRRTAARLRAAGADLPLAADPSIAAV